MSPPTQEKQQTKKVAISFNDLVNPGLVVNTVNVD